MRQYALAACAALILTLAGCSGGSDSSPGSVVTPTPSPSPSPPPVTNTNLGNMTADRLFVAPATLLLFSRTAEGQVQFTGVNSGMAQFSYLAATTGWQVRNLTGVAASTDANPNIAFGPGDLVASASDARYASYKRTIDGFDFSLKLLKTGPANDLIALTYSSIGTTLQGRSPPLTAFPTYTNFRQQQFAYGFETPASASLPTGNVQYHGVVLGGATALSAMPNSPVFELTGTIDVTVNFAASTASGAVRLSGKNDRSGAVVDFGTFNVALVDGVLVLESPWGGPGGTVNYQAFGPAAEELGGAARLEFTPPGGPPTYISIAFATKR